jgi:hypothetical protein
LSIFAAGGAAAGEAGEEVVSLVMVMVMAMARMWMRVKALPSLRRLAVDESQCDSARAY